MEQRRRIGAYGVCHNRSGQVLLVRASARSARPGTWFLPGGGIRHGEHPADAVVRELAEETGLAVEIVRVRDAVAEVVARPPYLEHTDGVVYDLQVTGGSLRPEVDGTADDARWVAARELPTLPLSRFAARTLGMPAPDLPDDPPVPARVDPPVPPSEREPDPPPDPPAGPAPRPHRGQRFAVYGLATDPSDRVLLTLNAEGYPGAGQWHLPGGGTHFGEQPVDGLLREITEESGQEGQVRGLLAVTHHHRRAAWASPPVDWHGVAVVFGVSVADPSVPHVVDAGGSTAEAAWFTRTELRTLNLTRLAIDQLGVTV